MKLFIYEHCPFCLRTRMIAGLKNLPIQYEIIMEGDEETAVNLVGKKVVPILQKDDGSYLTESLDIVKYLDQFSEPYFTRGKLNQNIEEWIKTHSETIFKLIVPRFVDGQFKEIETPEARLAFKTRETKAFGDLEQLKQDSAIYISEMNSALADLEHLMLRLSIDITDFILFPWLRSLTIVKGLEFKPNTLIYMQRIAKQSKVNLLFDQAQ